MNNPPNHSALKRAIGIALILLGALLLAYVAVWATGTVIQWSFDAGVCFLLACGLLAAAAGALVLDGRALLWLRQHRAVRAVMLILFSLFVLSFLTVEAFVLYGAGLHQTGESADFLLIPGASVVGDRPSLILRHRLEGAIPYLKANPAVTVIVSGGRGEGKDFTEAAVMKDFLVESGIDGSRILEEDRAANTIENLAYSKRLMVDRMQGKKYKLMIVTSDFHMFRILLLAKVQGIDACGSSVPVHWTIKPISYSREYFSVMKLLLTGMRAE